MTTATFNRRAFERFRLRPMYTQVLVQRIDGGRMHQLEGYAVDISEGGLRIELDERLEVGEHINVTLSLAGDCSGPGDGAIRLACQVVWQNDEIDDPIMPRLALRIRKYLDDASRARLLRHLGTGSFQRAA